MLSDAQSAAQSAPIHLGPISERGKELYFKSARFLANLFTLENRIEFKGLEHKFKGRKIIVGPHKGKQKDISATIIAHADEQIYFLTNEKIFSPDGFDFLIKKNLRKWFHFLGPGATENMIIALKPVRYALVKFITSNIRESGMIPVNVDGKAPTSNGEGNGSDSELKYQDLAESYLLHDRPLVFLQHNRKHTQSQYHPELEEFKMGAFKLAYNMLTKYGVDVPVVPMSIKGTRGLFAPLRKIIVNFGEPMYISDPKYFQGSSTRSMWNFKEGLEKRVAELYRDS